MLVMMQKFRVALTIHVIILTLSLAPSSAYSAEDHKERAAKILIKKTKAVLNEIDRVKPSPKTASQGKDNQADNTKLNKKEA